MEYRKSVVMDERDGLRVRGPEEECANTEIGAPAKSRRQLHKLEKRVGIVGPEDRPLDTTLLEAKKFKRNSS
jgi:hypothetical protein